MGSKSPPPAPDYTQAANNQAQASKENINMQTWANRPNQNTPWGSTSWDSRATVDPATGQTVTAWTQNQTLDPGLQHALDSQIALQGGRSDMAKGFMDRVQDDMGANPFNWDKINAQNPMGQAIDPSQYKIGPTGAVTSVAQQQLDLSSPQRTTTGNERLNITGQDTSGLNNTTQNTNQANFVDERKRIEDQLFARMRPEHDRQQQMMTTQLANQGITPGSEAYNQQMQQLADNQARERFNAVQQGGQEQQGLQSMLMGQQAQAFGQTQASQQAHNQALNQLFQQGQGAASFNLGVGQQGFAQDLAAQQAQNAAKQAQFQQGLSAGQFTNQGLAQLFGQDQATSQQNYSQAMGSSQYQNQLRQQAIAEEAQRRNMSLNEMNALLSGQQVQAPQMPGFNTAGSAQAPELLKASGMQNQSNMDQFNAEQQSQQAMMSGLMGLGKAGMTM